MKQTNIAGRPNRQETTSIEVLSPRERRHVLKWSSPAFRGAVLMKNTIEVLSGSGSFVVGIVTKEDQKVAQIVIGYETVGL